MMTDKGPVPRRKGKKNSHFDVQLLDSRRRLSIACNELFG